MVKLNYLLTLFSLFIFFSFATAYEDGDECDELRRKLFPDDDDVLKFSCNPDENGKAISVAVKEINQDSIDTIANYKTIQKLTLTRIGEIKNLNFEALKLSSISIFDLKEGKRTNKYNGNPISSKVIKTLKNIEAIYITGYQITQDNINALSTLTNVKFLDIDRCGYDSNLNFSKFKNLKNMATLDISYYNSYGQSQPLGEFPESLCQVKQIKHLKIEDEISVIPKCINKLKNLEELDLSNNKIKEIPSALGDLSKLYHLDLSRNELTTISSSLSNLSKLIYLNLSSNKLTSISSGIYKLKSVETLNLLNNSITKITSNLKNMKNLMELNLANNEITEIPSSLSKVENLVLLDLSYNKINCTIPKSLNDLKRLNYINLSGNIDIKGKTLTNPSLETCYYNIGNNATEDGICRDKNSNCLPGEIMPDC